MIGWCASDTSDEIVLDGSEQQHAVGADELRLSGSIALDAADLLACGISIASARISSR
jgi:hypothetical protein